MENEKGHIVKKCAILKVLISHLNVIIHDYFLTSCVHLKHVFVYSIPYFPLLCFKKALHYFWGKGKCINKLKMDVISRIIIKKVKMKFRSCARGRQWCGIIHYYWWTASIKPRLLFSRADYASWGLSLSSV